MSWKTVFVSVSACALGGMLMGGLFGYAAGMMTPDFFRHIIPWRDVQPVGFAAFCGATAGVLLGGGLGCFGIIIQTAMQWRKTGASPAEATQPETGG